MLSSNSEPQGASDPAVAPGDQQPTDSSGRRISRRFLVVASSLALIAATAGLGMGWTMGTALGLTSQPATQPVSSTGGSSGSSSPDGSSLSPAGGTQGGTARIDLQAIASKVDPAIVDINTVVKTAQGTGQAAGTGMILTSSGEVLTNNHVVEGATSIQVNIAGRSGSYTATVVGVDPSADVALIQVQGVSGLPTVTLADSSTLKVGDPVAALGNALGQGGTPSETSGNVTALDQSITAGASQGSSEQLSGMIQMNAQISPGDSGGAVVNSSGEVVGMITAGASQGYSSTAPTTVGFAVPASVARSVVDQMVSGASSSQIMLGQVGYLGVSVSGQSSGAASSTAGAVVLGVEAGSPAEQAGIAPGSVITSVGGTSVSSVGDLGTVLHGTKPGQQVQIVWSAQGVDHSASVTLVAGPAV
ncbi:trypsin-like peptidase domain-containing protein [Candidatus Nephthysia bennettiae]|uniref:Trypsin-like peptidase domain-containing protein n=1 Tax=Candidatus Nephthysia bennettiae TaxID=3127016 RepID=A0A934KC65_9BACT|nr:trypsin-like peptidase domain-containing protein [Candidatus Dormibacteraeota bacterium]